MAPGSLILFAAAVCAHVAWADKLSAEQKADLPKFVDFWKANRGLKFKPADALTATGFNEQAEFMPLAVVSADDNSVKISVRATYTTPEIVDAFGANINLRNGFPTQVHPGEVTMKAEATLVVTSNAGKFVVARDTATPEKILAQDKLISSTAEATKYTALKAASVEQLAKTLEQFLNEPKDAKTWDAPLLAADDDTVNINPKTMSLLQRAIETHSYMITKEDKDAGFTINKNLKGFYDKGQFRDLKITKSNKLQFTAWYFADNSKGSRAAYPQQLAADDAILTITCNAVITGNSHADLTATVDRAKGVRAVKYWTKAEEKAKQGYPKRITDMANSKVKALLDATIAEISTDMTKTIRNYVEDL